MSKNLPSNRFFNVRNAVFAILVSLLLTLTAAASNTAAFSLLDSFKQFIGIESFVPPIGESTPKSLQMTESKNRQLSKEKKSPLSNAETLVDSVILGWETNGIVGNETILNSQTTNANLNISSLSRGNGINPATLTNAFNSNDFTPSGTFADALSNNDYLEFTVSPKSGFKTSLSALDVNFRRSSTGPNAFQWQYSFDGFATAGTNIGSAASYILTTTNGDAQTQINLSGISALQNVSNPAVITLRLYGYGATSSGGTFAIGRLTGNDLQITGSTSSITSPPTGLTYSQNPAVYTKNIAIADNTPSSGGGAVDSYSISPALPAGLSFNTSTGVISGTPTVVSPSTDYTVTASNAGGSTMAAVNITVVSATNYTIAASAGANGSISPSGNVSVGEGANQSFTITPDAGYQIADVSVDGASVGAVSAYQFTNVTANHTIAASFSNCASVSTPALTSPNNMTKTIPVNTSGLTGAGVIAAQFTFTYDPSVLSPLPADISVTPGAVLPTAPNAPQIDFNANTPGTIYVSVFGATPFSGAGSLVNINMKVIGAVNAVTPLGLSDFLYNGGLICANASSGTLTVVPTPTATSVSSSSNPSVYGTPVTFTAVVSPVPTGGTVNFVIDGATVAANVALNGAGEATYMTSSLTVAGSPHSVTTEYSGFGIQFLPSSGGLSGGQTVTKANQTISVTQAAPATAIYGTTFGVAADASSGLPVSMTSAGACSGGGSASATMTMTGGTGTCTVFFNQPGDSNYNAAPEVTNTTTAQKANATWTTDPAVKIYGDNDPVPLTTGSGSGFLAADNVTAAYSRAAGESVGTYQITAVLSSTGDLNNYNITNAGASFNISPRPATWTTNPASKLFGDADPAPLTTGSGANFLAADNVTATYTRAAGESVGTYQITANLSATGDLNNYTVTNAGASFTIIERTLTGTVTYKNAAVPIVPVANTTITATGGAPVPSPVINLLDGTYSMSGFGAGAYTVSASKADQSCLTPRGIFADDASLIARHVVRLITLGETQIEAGKVSGLSQLTSFDAALVAQYVVCIGSPINQSGQWKFAPASVTVGANTAQNFEGILKGDVNGSWTADTMFAETNPLAAASDAQNAVLVSLPDTSAAQGSLVSLPLRFDKLGGNLVGSYQFDIEYDPAVVEPVQGAAIVAGTNAETLSVLSNAPRPGLLKVVVYGAQTVGGDGVYANLRFNVIGGSGAATSLGIRGFRLNNAQAEVVISDGRLIVAAASNPMIRGRILAPTGESLARARVVLTTMTGERRTVLSNSFGGFEFTGLAAGETCTISVAAKGFRFTPRIVSITTSVIDLDMIAEQ